MRKVNIYSYESTQIKIGPSLIDLSVFLFFFFENETVSFCVCVVFVFEMFFIVYTPVLSAPRGIITSANFFVCEIEQWKMKFN